MKQVRLTIAYDGSRFAGWQIQPDRPTIQGEIEAAFERLTGLPVRAQSAGRTDAGVHALGQVAAIRTETDLPNERILMGMQHFLPEEITIREVKTVPFDFHPAFSATSKTYRYVMLASRARNPFLRSYAWRVYHDLDETAMRAAAQLLIGRHDFRCFQSTGSPRSTTVRTIFDLTVTRCNLWPILDATAQPPDDPAGPGIIIEVTGNGFLYNMVRAIAGTLYEVGIGKRSAQSVADVLRTGNRAEAGQTAPAQGLFLVRVDYNLE